MGFHMALPYGCSYGFPYGCFMKYKYRHQEIYKDKKIDIKSNSKKELIAKIQRKKDQMYDIRHTYCTNLERAGVPINIASRLMGHSDISLTSKIYTHASSEALEIARMHLEEYQKEKEA